MTSEEGPSIRLLSEGELVQVLGRAREERWRELALLSVSLSERLGTPFSHYTEEMLRRGWAPDHVFYIRILREDLLREIATAQSLISLGLVGFGLGAAEAGTLTTLTNLVSLNLDGNKIGDEGAKRLAALTSLTSLELWANDISHEGAKAVSKLTSLTALNLEGNEIGPEGASELAPLTKLSSLHLNGNLIGDEGAKEVASLANLVYLDLSGNRIGDQGARALGGLTNLRHLLLWGNDIEGEGAQALGALSGLTRLYLGANRIGAEGARGLSVLTNLTVLELTGDGIDAEGAKGLAALTNLTHLDLYGNNVGAEGAKSLAALTNLTSLNLGGSRIGNRGADELATLTDLTSLRLSFNNIDDWGAKAIGSLTKLAVLNLEGNDIGDEGAKALTSLTSLVSLDLSRNKIGDEGARAISALPSLTKLRLQRNKIITSRSLSRMPSLSELYLYDNPVTDVPTELLGDLWSNCLPALRAYWHDLDHGTVPNRTVQVLLVGNSCVGKTTLAYCLNYGRSPEEGENERTHGIELQTMELNLPRGGTAEVRLWDFGGQECYHAMHRLFLRRGAFFLLFWAEETDESPSEERHPVSYWLEMIRQLTDDAKILLVKNKIDLRNELKLPPSVDKGALAGKPRVKTSAVTYLGVERLKKSLARLIEKARSKWQRPIPRSWQRVLADLRRLHQLDLTEGGGHSYQTISLEHFEQICVEHGVEDRDVLLRFLHDTGEVFHLSGQFGDSIILDQTWLIDKLYRLFDRKGYDHGLAGRLRGELKGSDFRYFRQDEEAEWETCFNLMLQTRMAFELDRGSGKSFGERTIVVPALFPKDDKRLRPQLRHWDKVSPDKSWLRLEYPFLHQAPIERLVVELNELSELHLWWGDGLEFTDPITGCLALLMAPMRAGHLDLRLQGGRQVETFARISHVLTEVLKRDPERTLVSNDGKAFVDLAKLDESIRVEARLIRTTTGAYVERKPYDRFCPFAGLPELKGVFVQPREPPLEITRIVISWSRKEQDQAFVTELETSLKGLNRPFTIDLWHGGQVMAGAVVVDEIYNRLEVADIVLLLISPDFMASDECCSSEADLAWKKHEANPGAAVPILVRPTEESWKKLPIGQLQTLPRNGQPVMLWTHRDEAWANVIKDLRPLLARRTVR